MVKVIFIGMGFTPLDSQFWDKLTAHSASVKLKGPSHRGRISESAKCILRVMSALREKTPEAMQQHIKFQLKKCYVWELEQIAGLIQLEEEYFLSLLGTSESPPFDLEDTFWIGTVKPLLAAEVKRLRLLPSNQHQKSHQARAISDGLQAFGKRAGG